MLHHLRFARTATTRQLLHLILGLLAAVALPAHAQWQTQPAPQPVHSRFYGVNVWAFAILDADKEGFLRSDVSLIQIAGRAARHVNGKVIMYGDKITNAMKVAMLETSRRREIQRKYNEENHISPVSVKKEIKEGIEKWKAAENLVAEVIGEDRKQFETKSYLTYLKDRMLSAAKALEFDKAARYRDEIRKIEEKEGLKESILSSKKP